MPHYCLDDSPYFRMIELGTVSSTNDFLQGYRPPQPADIILVTAERQTAGRGQQGNSWESEEGSNLLFSLLLHPTLLPASRMFVLSEAIALSLRDAAAEFAPGEALTVKWPNDLYAADRKLAGILFENELAGQHVGRSIIGCGLNVNQQHFRSDAPNPVSLRQLTGHDVERRFVLEAVIAAFVPRYERIRHGDFEAVHTDYLAALYRRTGCHTYKDAEGIFRATLHSVEPTGHLVLTDTSGRQRRYAFKEVAYVPEP